MPLLATVSSSLMVKTPCFADWFSLAGQYMADDVFSGERERENFHQTQSVLKTKVEIIISSPMTRTHTCSGSTKFVTDFS